MLNLLHKPPKQQQSQKESVRQDCAVMQDALDPVWKLHEQKHLPLRTAAFVYALENVIKVAKARGYGG